jgi:hydroxymethylglutaryl-CoA synthase
MKTGISALAIYIPPLYLSHDDLADFRSVPREKFSIGLGNKNMAIVPQWEDTVTMGANAAEMAIENAGIRKEDIGLLIVSTETAVDQSKPIASFIQGLLGIGPRTRVYEIKHACYGGTAAIMNAIDWIISGHNAGKIALVITSDISNYGLGTSGEPTQGAGAVACIVSEHAEFIHFSPSLNACYSEDVYDFWRPNGNAVPVVDGKYSIACYLKALKFCSGELQENIIKALGKSLLDYFDYFVYHTPFGKMAFKAHYHLITTLNPGLSEKEIKPLFERSFEDKVKPTLWGAKEVGNIYTGSVYMNLISLMEEKGRELTGKSVAVFSYGSGCGAEYFPMYISDGAQRQFSHLNLREQVKRRRRITIEEYTQLYSKSNRKKITEPQDLPENEFSRYYFAGIKDEKRIYFRR